MIPEYCPKCKSKNLDKRYDATLNEIYVCRSCKLEFIVLSVEEELTELKKPIFGFGAGSVIGLSEFPLKKDRSCTI